MKSNKFLLKLLFILVLPLILMLLIFFIRFKPPMTVSANSNGYFFGVYSDALDGGKSTASLKVANNKLEVIYTLDDFLMYPNISLFWEKSDKSLIDYSGYDYITIEVESEKSKFVLLNFNIFIDGHSSLDNFSTLLPLGYYLELNREDNIYRIPLDQFKIHTWWLSSGQVSEEIIKKYSLGSVAAMEVVSDPSFTVGVEDKIILTKVTFHTNLVKTALITLLVLGIYYLGYFLFVFSYKRVMKVRENKEEVILVPYQSIDLPKVESNESKIEKYICSNYKDPLLNIAKVEEATNIPEREISKILKKKYNNSFPGFINSLRIAEAKILLETTDYKILDIAMMVGYSSLGHFNRTFKRFEDSTPREYKKVKNKPPVI